MNAQNLIFIAELIGVAAFAISGVLVAIDRNLDLFGALVLGAITAVGGGMLRDVMIGHHPPMVFINPIYALLAVLVSLAVFLVAYFLGDRIDLRSERIARIVNFFDALGLGIFAIVGVDAVLGGEMSEIGFLAVFIGTITAVGGTRIYDGKTFDGSIKHRLEEVKDVITG